jgi:hypothetical protein
LTDLSGHAKRSTVADVEPGEHRAFDPLFLRAAASLPLTAVNSSSARWRGQ